MKKTLLLAGLLCSSLSFSQTTLFQDNFESGSGNWTLNGTTGNNIWVVNNAYAGFMGLIPDTPDQPVSFTGGPQSNYLHINNTTACSNFGACNANFDTGNSSNQSATMTNNISTVGYSSVTLEFWYICAGQVGTSFGIVEYSTDNGTTWIAASSQYNDLSTWTQVSIALPAFNNQSTLKFRFRWQNGNGGNDPAFSVDEVKITAQAGALAIITQAPSVMAFCLNTPMAFTIPFNVTGTPNAGNVYTAYLSDQSGSFAAPTAIGTLTSSSNGTLSISANIPGSTPAGTGYRVRVDASDPVTQGIDNGTDIVLYNPPTILISSVNNDSIICPGESLTLTATGGVSYAWLPPTGLSSTNTATVSANPSNTTTYTVSGTDNNGCIGTQTFKVIADDCLSIDEQESASVIVYPNPASTSLIVDLSAIKESIEKITIADLTGRLIQHVSEKSNEIIISSLESGKYFLVVHTKNNVYRKQFVKL